MKRLIIAALVAATLTGCAQQVPPCPSEGYDGPTVCYWDAHSRGNHEGRSFIWDGRTIHYTDSK